MRDRQSQRVGGSVAAARRSVVVRVRAAWLPVVLLLIAVVAAGCSQSGGADSSYGGPQNHLHDILALRGVPNTVLLATHIGLYRTADGGQSWVEVAGGSGQVMDGLMLFKLVQSPVVPQRVYVLAVPRPDNPGAARAAPGVYTSADAGKTWTLATPLTAFPTRQVFTIGAGSTSAGQLFAIVPGLGVHGLFETSDGGGHWAALPALPAASLNGVFGAAGRPHRVLLWSVAAGVFTSDDDGQSWSPSNGIRGGIYSVSQAGATIYADGDAGVYVSSDVGSSFTLADGSDTFSAVVACAANPAWAYAITGTSVFVSADSAHSWKQAAATSQHPTVLTVDPANCKVAFVGLSYPLGVEVTANAGGTWRQVLP